MVEPADFTRALDADPVARTAYHRLSCSRKREHVLAIESAQAKTCVRRIEKALAMLRDQELAGAAVVRLCCAARLTAVRPSTRTRPGR